MCIVSNNFIGFMLFIQSNERGLFETDYFPANVYNALQPIHVFLTDVPKPNHKRKYQNTLDTRLIKHGQYGAINVKRAKFSEAVKTLLAFSICDTAVAVPLQPIVNWCAEVFILVNKYDLSHYATK